MAPRASSLTLRWRAPCRKGAFVDLAECAKSKSGDSRVPLYLSGMIESVASPFSSQLSRLERETAKSATMSIPQDSVPKGISSPLPGPLDTNSPTGSMDDWAESPSVVQCSTHTGSSA